MNLVIVGGGPTGVELSGALAEMKNYVLPKDYPELDFQNMQIYLVEAGMKLLGAMSAKSSRQAIKYLTKLNVNVILGKLVTDFNGTEVFLNDNSSIHSKTLIWAAGIKGNHLDGLDKSQIVQGNRFKVDNYNRVSGYDYIFAIGDIAAMIDDRNPKGHPQVAQVAIQQARCLGRNLICLNDHHQLRPFSYKDLGTLATVGRNKAVVDLPFIRFQGLLAWFFWMFIHLMSIVGVKNRLLIFVNWAYHYFTYDQSLRLIIKPKVKVS